MKSTYSTANRDHRERKRR